MLHDTTDADEKEMLQMDISENEAKLPQLEEDIKYMLIPSDPNDDKNTIVEIRSAAGGDEAAIFAGDLYKMYQRFCESRGWKTTVRRGGLFPAEVRVRRAPRPARSQD